MKQLKDVAGIHSFDMVAYLILFVSCHVSKKYKKYIFPDRLFKVHGII